MMILLSRDSRPAAPTDRTQENPYLRTMFRTLWIHLPVLLIGSAAVGAAMLVTLVAAAAWTPAAALLTVVAVAPTVTALVAVCGDALRGRDVLIRAYGRALRHHFGAAVGLAAVPVLLAGLTALAYLAWQGGGPGWLLAPMALGLTCTVLTAVGWLAAMPLRVVRNEPVTSRTWLLALHLLARGPIPFVAAVALASLGVWVSGQISNALFLLVPAPVSLTLAAAYLTVAGEHDHEASNTPR